MAPEAPENPEALAAPIETTGGTHLHLPIKDIIDQVRAFYNHDVLAATHPIDLGLEVPYVVLPKDRQIVSLADTIKSFDGPEFRDRPSRIIETAELTTVDSFIQRVRRHADGAETVVFANDRPEQPSLLAILDYHDQANDDPSYCTHRCVYRFPVSEAFLAWMEISANFIGQADFAEFLETRRYDIINPPFDWMQVGKDDVDLLLKLLNLQDDKGELDDNTPEPAADRQARLAEGADLDADDDRYIPRSGLWKLRQIKFGSRTRIEALARGVKVAVTGKAAEAYSPKTGERQLTFEEGHEVSAGRGDKARKVTVPDALLLSIPLFEGEANQLIPVDIRYRLRGGAVQWRLAPVNTSQLLRHAIKREADRVASETSLPVYYGTPDVGTRSR